jgi:hypothetical protein
MGTVQMHWSPIVGCPETATDWLVHIAAALIGFFSCGLMVGPARALILLGATVLMTLAIGELRITKRCREPLAVVEAAGWHTWETGAVFWAGMLVAYALEATVFPDVRLAARG